MIKITNKTHYALRFLIHVAEIYPTGHLSIAEVASKENISEKFLESIVSQLKAKGIVRAKRGAGGGYYLSLQPSAISLMQVIEAVESEMPGIAETDDSDTHTSYVIRQQLLELDKIITQFLKARTIADLQQAYDQLQAGQMFYI
ncbi:MAG TPA: Rrf2 family transcriptional regulator [Bacteroidales bacterium]|nr:Rrf2 family transcriptional regulator [Bacteroidales bacterium]